MTAKHFLFIESNTTGTGGLALERLLASGRRVTFFAREPGKYPFLEKLGAGAAGRAGLAVEVLETNEPDGLLERIETLRRKRPVDAVLTFSEYYIEIVAGIAARLGLPYLDPEVARRCRDKSATREALAAAGLGTPDFHLAGSPAEARRIAGKIAYPCVVKPLSESSSAGVRQVGSAGELLDHFAELHRQRTNARGQPLTGRVLIESLLTGPEFSVETVTAGAGRTLVVGVVAKHLSPPPLFVEMGHDYPADLDPAVAATLSRAAVEALDALGYDFGPAHTELRLTPDGPVVVEVNPRLAGGMIPELVLYAHGVDLLDVLLAQLEGAEPEIEPSREQYASIRFLVAPRSGRLAGVDGLEAARAVSGIREVSVNKPPGAEVRPAEEATGRLGHVIAGGPDRRQVAQALEEALGRLEIRVEPSQSGRIRPLE